MTRGRCGSLGLHRTALSSAPPPPVYPGALTRTSAPPSDLRASPAARATSQQTTLQQSVAVKLPQTRLRPSDSAQKGWPKAIAKPPLTRRFQSQFQAALAEHIPATPALAPAAVARRGPSGYRFRAFAP